MKSVVDILVKSSTGHPDVVVDVTLEAPRGEMDHLRKYMRGTGASVGMIVSRQTLILLRETYRGENSIEVVGEYPTALATDLDVGGDGVAFEERVQTWLEELPARDDAVEEPLRSALRQHVIPYIEGGDVRAAGPRTQRAAS
jgi:hypothetical protein